MTEFIIGSIPPEKARSVVRLTSQDVTAGEFENPLDIANENDPARVEWQEGNLRANPQMYAGLYEDGDELDPELLGYMKSNFWKYGDQAGFMNPVEKFALRAARKLRLGGNAIISWGVLGLVVNDQLDTESRDRGARELLSLADAQAYGHELDKVRIVLHDNDPLQEAVSLHGYRPIRRGRAAGVPGVESIDQTLYENTI